MFVNVRFKCNCQPKNLEILVVPYSHPLLMKVAAFLCKEIDFMIFLSNINVFGCYRILEKNVWY